MTTKWDEEDLIYAAGFLDGEGCFHVQKHDKISILCSNTYKPVIEWLGKTFGGSVHRSKRKRKENHRTIYTWQVVCNDALRVCQAVAPYLKEKTAQALLLITLQQLKTKGGRKLSKDERQERDRLIVIFKGMKHVAW